ncbi:uncharacterized protein N7482_010777 [Penicillium canariense]|uniref:Endonuclease/exonuclease/phosphatase domain-containing protein n=1 Tax=Penicillium canariense TaxID=189055 RepID=A0A9W9HMU1_9EURO|nr:uncharacterized protein N7482_010777 [Penicillium canariense]KAJ5151525.1 hypothetical protein N7482_010777 [Penicillium canariense]
MATLLRERGVRDAGVVAIQEPWENNQLDTTHHPATASHQLLYPVVKDARSGEAERTRVCMFVSKRIDPSIWSHTVVNADYQILKLRRNQRDGWTDLFVHNIYRHDTNKEQLQRLYSEIAKRPEAEHVVVGDFNLHHPLWGGPSVRKTEQEAHILVDSILPDLSLTYVGEPGKPTWQQGPLKSVIDLTFVSSSLLDCLTTCEIANDVDSQSDHLPIRTVLDITTPQFTQPRRRNWEATDDEKLKQYLEQHLPPPPNTLTRPETIELACSALMRVVDAAVEFSTPWADPSSWSNPGFDEECREAIKEARRLRRVFSRTQDMEDWAIYTMARNKKHIVDAYST